MVTYSRTSKRLLRQQMIATLQNNPSLNDLSQTISEHLWNILQKKSFKKILIFKPLSTEPNVTHVTEKLIALEKEIFTPKLDGGRWKLMNLKTKVIHKTLPSAHFIQTDIVLVPGIAFCVHKDRLGRGGGIYDRLLENTGALKIGICFDFQVLDSIPIEDHDQKIDIILSDKRTIT